MNLKLSRNLKLSVQPRDLGLPDKFTDWRESQRQAVEFICRTTPRFHLLNAPTGAGKSLTYAAMAQLLPTKRVLILTSTRGLQDQVAQDFGRQPGFYDARGASNYTCLATSKGGEHEGFYGGREVTCDEGPCKYGYGCSLRSAGCLYYDRVARAATERVVVTNYSFLFHSYYYSTGIGQWDVVVCDEAHEAPDELSGFLATEIAEDELDGWADGWASEKSGESWRWWAKQGLKKVEEVLEKASDKAVIKRFKRIWAKLLLIARMQGQWEWHEFEAKDAANKTMRAWRWAPLWPAPYAEEMLFRHAKRVIFTSATARPKTLALLGVQKGGFDTFEAGHSFPSTNRLVCVVSGREFVPQVRYNWTQADIDLWVKRHDEIIEARLDRKGLIHTTSYTRAKLLRERSRFARYMYVPWSGNTREKVEAFKRAKAPAILVSPAITTGWDFPDDTARYQILSKVPFPDTTDPITAARQKDDPDYGAYLAAVAVVQAAGRAVRGPEDWCETFLLDRNFDWFLKKNAEHFPEWFKDALYWSYDKIPAPRTL